MVNASPATKFLSDKFTLGSDFVSIETTTDSPGTILPKSFSGMSKKALSINIS